MHKNIIRSWHLLCIVGCLMITLSNPVAVLAQTGEIKLSVSFQGENSFVYFGLHHQE